MKRILKYFKDIKGYLLILFIFINCFATENVLVSTFSKGPMDGYSWRQRQINYDITDTNLSKEKLISTIWRMNFEINPYAVLVLFLQQAPITAFDLSFFKCLSISIMQFHCFIKFPCKSY